MPVALFSAKVIIRGKLLLCLERSKISHGCRRSHSVCDRSVKSVGAIGPTTWAVTAERPLIVQEVLSPTALSGTSVNVTYLMVLFELFRKQTVGLTPSKASTVK